MSSPLSALRGDPGLRFWRRYAETEGALTEDRGDHVLALLPVALQEHCGLPEMVTVTAEPEVAREDGALLLLPGHPVVDGAATRVVEGGDAGHTWLAWPQRELPTTAALAQRARESVVAEHGRLDRDREVGGVWQPVLRLGAVVTTSASLDLRFQERHEVWVDARTGLELPAGVRQALTAWPWSEHPDHRRRVLAPDLTRALSEAHRLLAERARERAAALATEAAGARTAELARVAAYYDAALRTIDRRRQATDDAERRSLLDAQAEATREERERRRREVEDSYRTSHQVRPFRAHLMLVPAARLPVVVRRGATTFPLELVWLLPAHTFAPIACPHCGRGDPLVAGRQRLGCTACLPRPVTNRGSHPAPPPTPPQRRAVTRP